jgi:fructosamine-3-kinase
MEHLFPGERVVSYRPVTGGCINYCYRIVTNERAYFVKFNAATRYPRIYACEALALNAMAETKAVNVPQVLQEGTVGDTCYLVLEYIELGAASSKALEQLGRSLALLHRQPSPLTHFGWPHDNYIGSLKQTNTWCSDWPTFYEDHRVLPLCRQLQDEGEFNQRDTDQCKRFLDQWHNDLPHEAPALLHGDLWSGNYVVDTTGHPYLVDPASYYGHREMDIALTQLFGGFGNSFIDAYNETFPLKDGWQQRLPYFQLYPLLVHAVIFGASYVDRCRNIFGRLR